MVLLRLQLSRCWCLLGAAAVANWERNGVHSRDERVRFPPAAPAPDPTARVVRADQEDGIRDERRGDKTHEHSRSAACHVDPIVAPLTRPACNPDRDRVTVPAFAYCKPFEPACRRSTALKARVASGPITASRLPVWPQLEHPRTRQSNANNAGGAIDL